MTMTDPENVSLPAAPAPNVPSQALTPVPISQPAPPVPLAPVAATPPGWYRDHNSGQMRWWDGQRWTENFAPAPQLVRAAKDSGIAYLLLILLGGFGAHYFYLGRIGSAIGLIVLWWGGIALTTIGIGVVLLLAALIWVIVDLFMIPSYVREANGRALSQS